MTKGKSVEILTKNRSSRSGSPSSSRGVVRAHFEGTSARVGCREIKLESGSTRANGYVVDREGPLNVGTIYESCTSGEIMIVFFQNL